jgi:mannose-6-phosphate isomerase-like protein (cupin superfamily)
MQGFEFLDLKAGGAPLRLRREAPREALVVCRGWVRVVCNGTEATLLPGCTYELREDAAGAEILTQWGDAQLFRAWGRWQAITSSGVFTVSTASPPAHDTPVTYRKSTGFDNHYHDCDEYWIFFEGRCRAVSEGKVYDVGPGDCVATGMGWHHDVQRVLGEVEPVRAVWFEGTLEGRKRLGHLWEPKHGRAEPRRDRA